MEVNLEKQEANFKPQSNSSLMEEVNINDVLIQHDKDINNIKQENINYTVKSKLPTSTEISINDNDDSALLVSFPKAEVKLRKLDEKKLLMDNNENSLSVDSLIEILSSSTNENKLSTIDNVKKGEIKKVSEENGSINNNVPPSSVPTTLSSPSSASSSSTSSSSSSSKTGNAYQTPIKSTNSISSPSPKKFPSPHYSNGGKPMLADLNKKMKQVSRRQPRPKAVYQSQISDNSVGIKLCIKKSINTIKSLPSSNSSGKSPRKRSRKPKTPMTKVGCESDSDDSYVKRRKKSSGANCNNNNTNKGSAEEPVEQSGWGKTLPKEVLCEVCFFTIRFMFVQFLIIQFFSL